MVNSYVRKTTFVTIHQNKDFCGTVFDFIIERTIYSNNLKKMNLNNLFFSKICREEIQVHIK